MDLPDLPDPASITILQTERHRSSPSADAWTEAAGRARSIVEDCHVPRKLYGAASTRR